MRKLTQFLMMLTLGLFLAGASMAQVTTSGMTGTVTTSSGDRLPGATVLATHMPSGSQYGNITKSDGSCDLQGMARGGT